MDEKILYYKKFTDAFPRRSIKEMEELLKDKTLDNKNKFIEGFIHYVYRSSLKLYLENEMFFNAYYDFEEFFNDGIIVAEKLFMDKKMQWPSFNVFLRYFSFMYNRELAKTYFMKINYESWKNVKEIIKAKMHGELDMDIQKKNDVSKTIVKNVKTCDYLKSNMILDDTLEEEIIHDLVAPLIQEDITKIIKNLSFWDSELMCSIYGLEQHEVMSQAEIARNYYLERQAVNNEYKKTLTKICKKNAFLKYYL